MGLKDQIDQDLKKAMLAGDKQLATTLRGLKSVILYAEVATGKRSEGLIDSEVVELLRKEAKKRQESADLYIKGNAQEKADAELAERKLIEQYLPKQLDDDQLAQLVSKAVEEIDDDSPQAMGRIIGRVKSLSDGGADGARIAAAVRRRLENQ